MNLRQKLAYMLGGGALVLAGWVLATTISQGNAQNDKTVGDSVL